MPVGLDRFVRVMSGGLVVTDKLVQVRTEKVNAAIKEVDDKIKEVKATGMTCPQLDKTLSELNRDRDAALKLKGNKEKCEALEPIRSAHARPRKKRRTRSPTPRPQRIRRSRQRMTRTRRSPNWTTGSREVKSTGMACTELEKTAADLVRDRDEALKLTNNKAKWEALEPITQRAGVALQQAVTEVANANKAKQATDDAVKAMKAIQDEAASLKKIGFDTKQLDAEFDELVEMRVDSVKLTNSLERIKAETAIKQQADEVVAHAQALSKAAKDAGATDKKQPNETQKSKIYQAALKNYYGIEIDQISISSTGAITPASGMTNLHLDKVFDMFGSVPKKHVVQNKLKKLSYTKDWDTSGAYASSAKLILMGDFGAGTTTEKYKIGDKEIDANQFNVTTLHKIGHAVDADHTIMDNHMGTAGCGKWKKDTIDEVATACVAELTSTAGLSKKLKEQDLKKAVIAAVKDGKTDKPNEIETADWDKIKPWLTSHVLAARAKPYLKASPIVVGTSAYTQDADTAQWWSYDPNERTANGVNNYQWRTPAEWFAEIYAISWLAKKPPKGVAADIAEYMWGGDAA